MDGFCTMKQVMVSQRSDQKRRCGEKNERILYICKRRCFITRLWSLPTLTQYNLTSAACSKNIMETDSLPWDASIRIETVASGGKILKFG
jgi:hypothetical protein